MYNVFKIELFKIFKRPRTYIAFVALTIFIVLMQFGLKRDGKEFIDYFLSGLEDSLIFEGNIVNGYTVCFFILLSLLIHIPLLVVVISGDMISGEAGTGTLRLMLSKPITRAEFVLGKFGAVMVYIFLLLIWFAILALFGSLFIFGPGDVLHMKNEYIVQISHTDILWRYYAAFVFACLALITIAALSFLISVFSDNTIVPIVITMCVIIVSIIINTMSIPTFNQIKPYLFTSYLSDWKSFFDVQVDDNNEAILGTISNLPKIIKASAVLLLHTIGFLYLTIFVLKRKDILS
jgi:ABC-2 type transport system permease protein